MDVATTRDGFLINKDDWTPEIAQEISSEEKITLTDQHWEIIRFVQDYYREYHITPIMRILAKAIGKNLGADKGKSHYLYSLFPEGPVKQSAKIAGLPKPPSCI